MWASLIPLILAKIFSDNLARFIALKTVLATLFIVVLPIVLNNFVYELLEYLFESVSSAPYDSLPDLTFSLSGLAGWFAAQIYLPDALNVILSAFAFRLFLNHIPFLRV